MFAISLLSCSILMQSATATETKKDKPAAEWAGTVGLSVISLTGNAESLTGALQAAAERKTQTWSVATQAFATYGQTRAAETGVNQVVALNGGLQARGDRRLSERFSGFLQSGVDFDHLKSVEYRYFLETGASYTWLERKVENETRLLLRTDGGFRWAEESRFQYYPTRQNVEDVRLLAPRVALNFRYLWDKNVGLFQDVEALFNAVGAPRWIVNSTSKVSARLTESWALGLSYAVRHDSAPAAGKKPTDTALTATLEWAF